MIGRLLGLPPLLSLALSLNSALAEQARRYILSGQQPPPYLRPPRYSISAIIPAYCEEKYIGRCITSLKNQTEPVMEVVVADSSPLGDATGTIARGLDCRVVAAVAGNASASRNSGVRASSGRVLLFIDADMVLAPDAVEQMSTKLNQGYLLVHPRMCNYDSILWNTIFFLPNSLRSETLATGCQIVHRSVYEAVGGIDEHCNPFSGAFCLEMREFSSSVAKLYGPHALGMTGIVMGASARRWMVQGPGAPNDLHVPVRQYDRLRVI